ncbi:MAG TPA: DNA polymerase/3'-5' exonuclease PolX [Thermoleophilaceae bacterium]|jgi:DNA polymerase (family 10)|nr:DNA polymerase/3'-5' exonuclease PolX [Thermoleophilaceae bacterium]
MRNGEIAEAFEELASLYELDGAVVYRVVAYRNAAKAIRDSGVSVEEMARQGRVEELSGVGKTIAEKIDALLETGSIPSADKLKAKIPAGLVEITRIPGLGPKRAKLLHDHLGVSSLDDLRRAAEDGSLKDVPGFGRKAEENVLATLAAGADGRPRERVLLSRALAVGEEMVASLRAHPAALRVELAGSARRRADTVKDLDIVAASSDPAALSEAFVALDAIDVVGNSGEAGAKAVTHSGLAVDLRIVPSEAFGNLLQHFTGSGKHNEALRTEAVRRGLHVSEYGISDDESGQTEAFTTEEEVYQRLGMAYVPPELREDRGELEAARRGELPKLVELDDLRGDLHMHTTLSDGRNSLPEMVEGARERGYEYVAITDHSASHGFGDDVPPDVLRSRIEEIRALDDLGIRVLAGTETNVLPDGTLDYDDDVLSELDWVVASLHTSFRLSEAEQTERMMRAMEHPLVDVIGHPTGRLIGRREPYAIDLDRVIAKAVETGTFLEINGNPDRRDLNDVYARAAVEAGVTIMIDSDSHGVDTLANIRYGVATARRAWLTAENVGNTHSWDELRKLRKRGE